VRLVVLAPAGVAFQIDPPDAKRVLNQVLTGLGDLAVGD